MIYFRADANMEIAAGHIMRCLSIAEAIIALGGQAEFITSDNYAKEMLINRGFHPVILDSDWRNMDSETDNLCKIIKKRNIKLLVVDSYQVTNLYLSRLSQCTKVVYIDDMQTNIYPVHGIISYGHTEACGIYQKLYGKTYRNMLILEGKKYIPLRYEFQRLGRRHVNQDIKHIMITTGGSDNYGLTKSLAVKVTEFFKNNNDNRAYCKEALNIHIIVGRFFPKDQLDSLEAAKKNYPFILYTNIEKISKVMLGCDICLSAGGTTLLELCACGTPTICFSIADNQVSGCREKDKDGLMLYAGDIRNGRESFIKNIEEKLHILKQENVRKTLSSRMQDAVDGLGAVRLAERLIKEEKDCYDSSF